MARYRAAQMTTAGLLAPCLASGLPSENAVLLSQRMPKEHGSVDVLLVAPIKQLLAVRGESPAKAARLKTLHELFVRETEVQLKRRQSFSDPAAVARFLRKRLGHLCYRS